MSFDINRLYKLLPAVYRIRDQAGKDPAGGEDQGTLHALMTVIAGQLAVLEENLDQLYDDQFIETCAEWVVPYIGDLVGARGLVSFPNAPFSERGQVAKTIAYRRRKGTAAVLEDLAFDVTGWKANVVEYFLLLSTTQYLNHLRPGNLAVAPISRARMVLEYANTPFDVLTHSADVRRIAPGRGKYNIPNIGIFLWRIQDYAVHKAPAYEVDGLRYTFDALGKDVALYNKPVTEVDITHLVEPINVPMPLRRYPFSKSRETWYGKDKSVAVFLDEVMVAVDDICICDLHDEGSPVSWANMPVDKVAIDPVLGRIALSSAHSPVAKVTVDYSYGFSADIGGGDYDKEESFTAGLEPVIQVPGDAATIKDALDMLGTGGGVVEIVGSDYYTVPAVTEVASGKRIEIRATETSRPVIIIGGEWAITGGQDAQLSLNGLVCCGGVVHAPLHVSGGSLNLLQTLALTHCTLVPGLTPFDMGAAGPRLIAEAENMKVKVSRCIVGGMRVADVATAIVVDSIVDGGGQEELVYGGMPDGQAGGALEIQNSTVIGRVKTTIMTLASNTIFHAAEGAGSNELPVEAERLQEGCIRFSYIPPGSRVPRPYRCQPATPEDAQRVKPVFNSLRYGDAAYCQLSRYCAAEIRQGAENDMEMGVFYHLYQPLCEYNLQTRLNEYLRFGLEIGFFYGS